MTKQRNVAPVQTAPRVKQTVEANNTPYCIKCEERIAHLKDDLCRLGAHGCIKASIVTILINRHHMKEV